LNSKEQFGHKLNIASCVTNSSWTYEW